MNIFTKSVAIGSIFLVSSLALSACASGDEIAGKEVGTPVTLKSEEPLRVEIESDITQTNDTLVDLEVIPYWAKETFDGIPAGEWVYRGDDSQLRATSESFNADAIVDYVTSLRNQGWLTAPGSPSGNYALTSSDGSQFLEIQRSTRTNEQGESEPATTITLTRNH